MWAKAKYLSLGPEIELIYYSARDWEKKKPERLSQANPQRFLCAHHTIIFPKDHSARQLIRLRSATRARFNLKYFSAPCFLSFRRPATQQGGLISKSRGADFLLVGVGASKNSKLERAKLNSCSKIVPGVASFDSPVDREGLFSSVRRRWRRKLTK